MLNFKRMAIVATIFLLLASPVLAGGLTKLPVLAKTDQKSLASDVGIELVQYSDDLIKSIGQHLGLIPKEPEKYAITYKNKVLGVIPPDSPLRGIQMHDACMKWGFGTDNWWVCEKRIDDTENLDWSKVPTEVYELTGDVQPILDIEPIKIIKERI